MPTVPTYRRQERYRAPSVSDTAPAPTRLPQAYENTLQEFGEFSQNALAFIDSVSAKAPFARQQDASREDKQPQTSDENAALSRADSDVSLRTDLWQTVRDTAAQKGAVSAQDLDDFAAAHFTPEQTDTPAARDYLLLRRTAQEEARLAQRQRRRQLAAQEETLVRQVGATAPSAHALETYLSAQLPVYEQRLQADGAAPQAAKQASAVLQADTAAGCVRQALAAGQDRVAQDVFEKYAPQLTETQRSECAQKILFSAAEKHAQAVWARSVQEAGDNLPQRFKWAQQQLAGEKDTAFTAEARRTLDALHKAEEGRQHNRQAQVYRSLLQAANADEAAGAVNRQRVLDGEQLPLASRAAQELFTPAVSQAGTFNRLYFSDDVSAVAKAYAGGQLSARDYCRLEAVRHARQAGQNDVDTRLLCRGIDRWSRKNNVPEKDRQDIVYAVLSSAAETGQPLDAWKHVKTLLEL